jgi:hypothetical protein
MFAVVVAVAILSPLMIAMQMMMMMMMMMIVLTTSLPFWKASATLSATTATSMQSGASVLPSLV